MIRKVMAGEEFLRAAGTVTKKLAKWLGERGYPDESAVEIAVERSADAARDLPKAEKLSRLLDDDYVEGYLMIERVEPGALWFEGEIRPVKCRRARRRRSAGVVRQHRAWPSGWRWRVLEVGNVYP